MTKSTRRLAALGLVAALAAPTGLLAASDEELRAEAEESCQELATEEAVPQDQREDFVADCVEATLAESRD